MTSTASITRLCFVTEHVTAIIESAVPSKIDTIMTLNANDDKVMIEIHLQVE